MKMKTGIALSMFLGASTLFAFDVVRDGKACASIAMPSPLPKNVTDAVAQFQNDVANLTGARLKEDGKAENRIELVLVPASLENDDTVHVGFPRKDTMRLSGGAQGLVRIFPVLLEKFAGVRYLYPTDKGTFYPPTKDFRIPEKEFTHKPFFNFTRALSNQYNPWLDILGAKWRPNCQHDIPFYILPVKEYIRTGNWPPPEVFPMMNGKRLDMKAETKKFSPSFQSDWQPCHTSRASIEEAVKNIFEELRREPDRGYISLSPNDNRGYCECPECAMRNRRDRKAFRMFGPEYLYKDHSNSYFHWCNEIAKRVSEKYPDLYFSTLAYREVHFAPDFKLHPKLIVYLCFDFGCSQYPDIFEKQKKWIGEWARTGCNLGIWEYGFGDSYYTLPRVGFKNQGKMFRFLADNNFRAFFGEGAESVGEGPKRYLYMKLMENPYADVDALLKGWYTACVGSEAAPYLARYFDFWENYWPEQASGTSFSESRIAVYHTMTPFGPYMVGLRKGDLAKCRSLMEKMLSAAEKSRDPGQKLRAKWLMASFEYYEACAKACFAEILSDSGALETPEQAVELLRNLPSAIKANRKRLALLEKFTTDPDLKWWRGIYRAKEKASMNSSPAETELAKAASFASDPYVREELKTVVRNKTLPLTIRYIANTIVRSEKENNLLSEIPDFAFLAKGKHSVELPLKNGEWIHTVPMKPGTYLVRVRVSVPGDAVLSEQTWLNLRLQARDEFGKAAGAIVDTPKISPEAGHAYSILNTVKLGDKTRFLQLIVNLFHFRDGTKVDISDVAVIPVSSP
ncbi:MAG: hypothetical protein BWY31_03311 [Lentisphaerae bacterium ADurb.Bin242]|nr:MAG: hypothetical protein BWY31_03311 [Lentisphaerae bacterium ADurb.Bin242]